MIKIKKDHELSGVEKYIAKLVGDYSSVICTQIIEHLEKIILEDKKISNSNYSQLITFLSNVSTMIFANLFNFTCHVAKQFPDCEHCSSELLEDNLKGIRFLLDFHENNKNEKEYVGEIKKI